MSIGIITGASSGLGIEFLHAAVAHCPEIDEYWLIARRRNRLESLAKAMPEKKVRILALDLTDPASFDALDEALRAASPEIRLLVNNAGFGKLGDFPESGRMEQLSMIDLNCRAMTAVAHAALPYLQKGGLLINISSIASFAPTPRMAVYGATKSYVMSFSRALGAELKPRGIHVLAVCPGPMETEFFPVAGVDNGRSPTFDILPHQNPAKMARTALRYGLKGRSVCTMGAFYKLYRFLAHILPKRFLMKFTAC